MSVDQNFAVALLRTMFQEDLRMADTMVGIGNFTMAERHLKDAADKLAQIAAAASAATPALTPSPVIELSNDKQ